MLRRSLVFNHYISGGESYTKLDYYALAANEYVNVGCHVDGTSYYENSSGYGNYEYGGLTVFCPQNSWSTSNTANKCIVTINGVEFIIISNQKIKINSSTLSRTYTYNSLTDVVIIIRQDSDSNSSVNYNNAVWWSAAPSSGGKYVWFTNNTRPYEFIGNDIIVGSTSNNSSTVPISYIRIDCIYNSTRTNLYLYPYQNDSTGEVVFADDDFEYVYHLSYSS